MILIALLVPVLMIAFLFLTTALEDRLFPRSAPDESADAQTTDVTGP